MIIIKTVAGRQLNDMDNGKRPPDIQCAMSDECSLVLNMKEKEKLSYSTLITL